MRRFVILSCVAFAFCIVLAGCGKGNINANVNIQNVPLLISVTSLPDVASGVKGKGFTCTGLAYDAKENVFWMGNCGKILPDDEAFHATIVKVTKDGKTNLEEIVLYELFPSMSDVQGVAVDTSDDTIWFCSLTESKIRHISKTGTDMGSMDSDRPTGIAYDNRTDTLWVLTSTELKNMSKDGSVLESVKIKIEGQDQLFLDETNHTIYFTAGTNYKGENYVYKVDLATKEVALAYILEDSCAVEGIYIEDETMYILNDGYYHGGKIPINQLNKYDKSKLRTEEPVVG